MFVLKYIYKLWSIKNGELKNASDKRAQEVNRRNKTSLTDRTICLSLNNRPGVSNVLKLTSTFKEFTIDITDEFANKYLKTKLYNIFTYTSR